MPRPASDTPAPRSPQGKAPALIPEPGPLDWLDSGLLARVTQAIRTCPRYGAGAGEVEAVRTHISAVFLTPEYVFKFKRPVALGFADFSTLSLRKRYCREEQRLNRRLAPEVYLEVLPLYASRETPGEVLSLAGGEQVVDWCVVMRRLPREDMLDARVRQGRVTPEDMASVASLLAEFHRRPSRRKHLEHFGSLEVLQGNWDENFRQMEPFIGRTIPPGVFQTLQNSVGEFIRRNEGVLRGRAAQGFIRDGHGDLRCEHIALGAGGIRIIDCIEFNDRFRFGDVANDLAFLLMDLVALGRPDLARALLGHYIGISGDEHLERLVAFYACYRAYVRGKVTSFKLNDATLPAGELTRIRDTATRFFQLAWGFARQMAPPVLLLVAGLMGTGKSVLAAGLADRTGASVFNSDVERKRLAAQETESLRDSGSRAEFGAGVYDENWNRRTYDALFAHAASELGAGRTVILDASFSRREERERAAALARYLGARLMLVECRLDEARTLTRLRERERRGGAVSDGRAALYPRQRDAFEPIAEFPEDIHFVLDTAAPVGTLVESLLPRLSLPPPLFG